MTSSALLVIDMQRAIDAPSWGKRNNPEAEQNIGSLLSHWRLRRQLVAHVRYESREQDSAFRGAGLHFKECAVPQPGEKIVTKPGACAFIGTDLLPFLIANRIGTVVIAGVITNNSVEATARVAGELGFDTVVACDAAFTFGRKDFMGVFRSADEVHAMSLANLDGQYAKIRTTAQILSTPLGNLI